MLPLLLLAGVAAAPSVRAQCALPGLEEPPRMPGVPFEELVRRADEASEAGQAVEAVRFYRAGVALNPLWDDGWWRLGQLFVDAGCHGEARDALRRLVRLQPTAGPGWTLLGLAEYHQGDFDQAKADLSRGMALGVSSTPEVGRQGLLAQTLLHVRGGDFASAAKNLNILVQVAPDDPGFVVACGLIALRIGKLPKDVTEAERELVLLTGRAVRAALTGRMDEARRGFDELIAKYPRRRGVHLAYAFVLSRASATEALAQLRREAELFPDNAEAHLEIAFETLERGDPREALEPARAAARLDPDSFWSHLALGRALLVAGAVEEALSHLENAARLAPERRDVYLALAQAYARAGRPSDVERARLKLQELDTRREP